MLHFIIYMEINCVAKKPKTLLLNHIIPRVGWEECGSIFGEGAFFSQVYLNYLLFMIFPIDSTLSTNKFCRLSFLSCQLLCCNFLPIDFCVIIFDLLTSLLSFFYLSNSLLSFVLPVNFCAVIFDLSASLLYKKNSAYTPALGLHY